MIKQKNNKDRAAVKKVNMKKLILIIIVGLSISTHAQTLPVLPKSKPVKPAVTKPMSAPAKTKIIYVEKSYKSVKENQNKTIFPEMVLVQGGSFEMGGEGNDDGKPIHSVSVSDFSICKYEVTVEQYRAFCEVTGRYMPESPSWGWNDKHPIVNVNYDDATAYCNWLSEKTGKDYRLPTEAEWEYAARGGKRGNKTSYSGSDDLDEVGWYADNSGGQVFTVGRKRPNELGLYDMTGNVWEQCKDWYDSDYYKSSPSSNPKGPSGGSYRVLRGGSWYHNSTNCRVAYRFIFTPGYRNFNIGFRVVTPSNEKLVSAIKEEPKPTNIPEMVSIPAGSFTMGSDEGNRDERPPHHVSISAFSIGKYEVTVEQYRFFCTSTYRSMPVAPKGGWNDKDPIVNINYDDAVGYCYWLTKLTGKTYRLPTEAEWEYAARGGEKSNNYTYSGSNDINQVSWYSDNSGNQVHAVGQKSANELGLYDMTGNVWEWCSDWYSKKYYANSSSSSMFVGLLKNETASKAINPSSNPKGPESGSYRVLRGGSWDHFPADCRVAYRGINTPEYRGVIHGFRVVSPQ